MRTLEHEGLNAEQVRRAVEHCNINAVNSKFASLQGVDRVVHIDGGPADPLTVMDALDATSSAPAARLAAIEYSAAPAYEKRAHPLPEGPRVNLPQLERKLKQAHDELFDLCSAHEFSMEQRLEELQLAAKHASNEGATLRELAAAWTNVHPQLAQVVAQSLRDDIAWSYGKVASRSIHPEHAVMQKFAAFASVALEFHKAAEARRQVETELARVSCFLDSQPS